MLTKKITSVLRISGSYHEFKDRLETRADLFHCFYESFVDYILVDYGTDDNASEKIAAFCLEHSWTYLRVLCAENNIAKATNFGIKASKTEFIIIEDIDVIHSSDFYKNVLEKIIVYWDARPFNFYTIPVVYLKHSISQKIIDNPKKLSDRYFLAKITDSIEFGDFADIDNFVPQSSLIILKRSSAFYIGLFDENFVGWGGEDRDFVFRLLAVNNRLKLPKDFNYTSTETIFNGYKFVGWKSLWTLQGDFSYNLGFISYHLWHPERDWKNIDDNKGYKRKNIQYAINKAKTFVNGDYYSKITPAHMGDNMVYIYGRNPHIHNIDLFEALGGFDILEETWSVDDIVNIVPANAKIIFWNPFGNEKKLQLYNELKAKGYKVYVAERGALPDSIVFDPTGLVIFSKMYDRKYWDKDIDSSLMRKTEDYIIHLKDSKVVLEQQKQEMVEIFRFKFQKQQYSKVVLICLQLSTDTVVTQNVDGYISYPEYLKVLEDFVQNAPDNVGIVVKNHPLSKEKLNFSRAFVADDYHIYDLIKECDCIVTYNSGTGIIARLFDRPVINFGPSSYRDDYFTYQISTSSELLSLLQGNLKIVPHDKVIRYFSYLINEFYSFAKFNAFVVRETDTARLSYPKQISYYDIKFICSENFTANSTYLDVMKGNVFKRYFHNNIITNNAEIKKTNNAEIKKLIMRKFKKLIMDISKKATFHKKKTNF